MQNAWYNGMKMHSSLLWGCVGDRSPASAHDPCDPCPKQYEKLFAEAPELGIEISSLLIHISSVVDNASIWLVGRSAITWTFLDNYQDKVRLFTITYET